MTKALAILDTDSVKKYVFGTNKLKEIRGASSLLDYLNRFHFPEEILQKEINEEDIIYSNGGTTLFISPLDKVQDLLNEGEKLYREKTISGSASSAFIEVSEDALKPGKSIDPLLKELHHKLRRNKDGLNKSTPLLSHAFIKYCDSCSVKAASQQDNIEKSFLCPSCLEKRKQDRDYRKSEKGLWGEFLEKYGNDNGTLEQPEDFSQIGKTSKNYIGLIYCDGNCMGKIIKELKSLEKFGEFSKKVDKTIRNETYSVLNELFSKEKAIYPFDFLLLGGDDLLIVTAADKALEATVKITEAFEEAFKKDSEKVTLSAGVIIAHSSYPIFNFLDLAEQLLKSAKKRNHKERKEKNENVTTIDFMVLSGSNSLELDVIRNRQLTGMEKVNGKEEFFNFTKRPYTVEELKDLMDFVKKFKSVKFPKNKLHFLIENLFTTKYKSMLETMTVMGRLRKNHKKVLKDFFDYFQIKYFPWKELDKNRYITPLLDLAEIYDFVSNGGGSHL